MEATSEDERMGGKEKHFPQENLIFSLTLLSYYLNHGTNYDFQQSR